MVERWLTVSAPGGLHARLAARVVRVARGVRARVTVAYRGRSANATSLTSLLALGADAGSEVRVAAEGDDAEAALDRVAALLSGRQPERIYHGRGVSPGVGAGRAVLAAEVAESAPESTSVNRDGEVRRLHAAVAEATAQLAALEVWAAREFGEASDVLRAERELLADTVWLELLEARIREGGASAEAAVRSMRRGAGLVPQGAVGGPHDGLREVLWDVGTRLVRLLVRQEHPTPEAQDGPLVLVARQVSPSELLEWPRDRLSGVAAAIGGAQSHAAVVARALRVPMVVDVGEGLLEAVSMAVAEGQATPVVRVDGERGLVTVEPEDGGLAAVRPAPGRSRRAPRPAEGERPAVLANADTVDEVRQALDAGAEGIGLVRTERLYLGREVPPDEEEQYRAFGAIAAACGSRPLALRLADLGGDKAPPYLTPLLGSDSSRWRGAGLLARYPALARPHLRALARVARDRVGEPAIAIMVPMVATRAEWEAILALWRETAGAIGAVARWSVLVETPAAVLDLEQFLSDADEVAIGSNDLTALLFGADRERGPVVLAPALQPVVVRLLAEVFRGAHARGAPVTVCGEAAGRLPEALVLWGMGVDGLSVGPGRVATVARALSALDADEVRTVTRDVVGMNDVTQVLARLERWRLDLASRGIALEDWPEGWEGHTVEHNRIDYTGITNNEEHRDDLGSGLA